METNITALSACCRELFPIIDMARSMAEDTNLPIENTTMNVSIHEDNSGALVLAQTSNIASTVYSMKQVLRDQDNLVSQRDLQERYSIEQDQHCRTIKRHFYQRSHKSCF